MKATFYVASLLTVFVVPSVSVAEDVHVSQKQTSTNVTPAQDTQVCTLPTYVRKDGKFIPVTAATCGDKGFRLASDGTEVQKRPDRSRN